MADRSPNYPAYDLGSALGFTEQLYKSEGKSNAAPAVVAHALGYKSLSGAPRQKIAAMRQYGLVEDVSSGKTRVSPRAVSLLTLDPQDPEYGVTLWEAALGPPLFSELATKNPDASDRNLEVVLINEKHFSPDGARRVLKAYRDTLAFAKAGSLGYTGRGDKANDEAEDDPADKSSDADRRRVKDEAHRKERHREASGAVTYSWPLDDAEKVEVTFVGNPGKKPTRRDLDALIDTLEGIRKRTPEVRVDEQAGE